jgi:hypothetical protein
MIKKWGPWSYDGKREWLVFELPGGTFEIDISERFASRSVRNELARAAEKSFLNVEALGWLVRAMNELGRLRSHQPLAPETSQ